MNQPATMPPVNVPHRHALNLHTRREFGPFTLDCALTLELGGDPRPVRPLRLRQEHPAAHHRRTRSPKRGSLAVARAGVRRAAA